MTYEGSRKRAAVAKEALSSLRKAHGELLLKFSDSGRNEIRSEIRLFRKVLLRFGSWAEKTNLCGLSSQAHWWEWYWYEREYGDSEFRENDSTTTHTPAEFAMPDSWIGLLAYTIDVVGLEQECQFGRTQDATSPLWAFDDSVSDRPYFPIRMPTLKEILDCSVPIIKSRLEDAVAKGLRKWEPDTSSVVFLRLLDTTVDAIDVTWRNFLSEYEIAIQIGRHTIRRRGKGSGVGVERITWLIDRSVGREVETDLDDLVSDVMRKAA